MRKVTLLAILFLSVFLVSLSIADDSARVFQEYRNYGSGDLELHFIGPLMAIVLGQNDYVAGRYFVYPDGKVRAWVWGIGLINFNLRGNCMYFQGFCFYRIQ